MFELPLCDLYLLLHLCRFEWSFTVSNSRQCGGQPVVFNLSNRVEFVIVTTGTIDGESEKRLPDRTDVVFEFILSNDGSHCGGLLILSHFVIGTGDQKSGSRDCVGVSRLKNITGQLHASEFVVGHVVV